MGRINVLDRKTAELIAAGEVIERPSSVVKELVENAIDSGATSVTVEIKNGGIRLIRVTDNGCGILREDVPTAFLRHATSKVRTEEDLYQIGTLGFRGEALASICAVSRVELLTRTEGEALGCRYRIEGGEDLGLEEAGCPQGTTIQVRDLFYNVPARMKFLKKDVTEGNAIATLMDRLALSHPEVSFRLIREGARKLQTPGDGKLFSAIHGVYGSDFSGGLIPVDGRSGNIRVTGYITRPEKARASRSMEHFFINQRYIRSGTMLAALEEAYKNSIMTGKFPGCVLNVELPLGMVDVNVHPAKLEVKFSDERVLFEAIYAACKGALQRMDQAVSAADTSKKIQKLTYFDLTNRPLSGEQQRMSAREYRETVAAEQNSRHQPEQNKSAAVRPVGGADKKGALLLGDNPVEQLYRRQLERRNRQPEEPAADLPPKTVAYTGAVVERRPSVETAVLLGQNRQEISPQTDQTASSGVESKQRESVLSGKTEKRPPEPIVQQLDKPPAASLPEKTQVSAVDSPGMMAEVPSQANPPVFQEEEPEIRLVGEAFRTYIIGEQGDRLLLVDKHAAHERILFEKLKAAHRKGGVDRQLLLAPVRIRLTREGAGALLERPQLVEQAGFVIEDFGDGSVLVREIPSILELEQVEPVVQEMAEMLLSNYTHLELDIFDELFHSIACKAAVKGGYFTGEEEQRNLLKLLQKDQSIRNCPHGRPVMIALTRRELEKMFGRIQ